MTALFTLGYVAIRRGQGRQTGEAATEAPATVTRVNLYNIPWGSGGVNFSAGLRGLHLDDLFLTHTGARDDFILFPACHIEAFFAVGQKRRSRSIERAPVT